MITKISSPLVTYLIHRPVPVVHAHQHYHQVPPVQSVQETHHYRAPRVDLVHLSRRVYRYFRVNRSVLPVLPVLRGLSHHVLRDCRRYRLVQARRVHRHFRVDHVFRSHLVAA